MVTERVGDHAIAVAPELVSSGTTTVAPASSARWNLASTSVTVRWMVTGVPPSDVGVIDLPPHISGKSSLSITVKPLMRTAAWISLPSGPGHAPEFDGVKSLDVEVDRRGGVVDGEVRGQCGFNGNCHEASLGGRWVARIGH